MNLSDIFPQDGAAQKIYCRQCGEHLELQFCDFHEKISGIDIEINGLPKLVCEKCKEEHLPDRSRFSIIRQHEAAMKAGSNRVAVQRKKIDKDFGFTEVSFDYDADDYFYIPGLARDHNEGFLTPVFFNKEVLLKYDSSPVYRVRFASTTYGDIRQGDDFSISFGVNKNGKIVMWLGDIAGLPVNEQHYLRSENVDSDHSIGSEFYDAQIECVFTEPTKEDTLFQARSEFLESCFLKFGKKLAHLDKEVLDLAFALRPPIVDTERERKHIADVLNKIYIESFDNVALGKVLASLGGEREGLASLKRLQSIIEKFTDQESAYKSMGSLFILYDLRVASLHLGSKKGSEEKLRLVNDRLGLDADVGLEELYGAMLEQMTESFTQLKSFVQSP